MSTTRKTTTPARKATAAKKAPARKPAARKAPVAKKAPAAKATTAKKGTATPKAPKQGRRNGQIQYYLDGRPTGTTNTIARIAFFKTKGIDGLDRVTTDRLRAILNRLGVSDPDNTEFEVTLPNGKVLSSKLGVSEALVRQPRQSSPKAADAKLATLGQMKDAVAHLKAAGRAAGPNKIVVSKANAATILAIPVEDLKTVVWEDEATAQPEVTPITKAAQTRRTPRKASARKAS